MTLTEYTIRFQMQERARDQLAEASAILHRMLGGAPDLLTTGEANTARAAAADRPRHGGRDAR